MKKIAIVTRRMIAGGIEKALISMIEIIPKNEFEITLFVMARGGEFEIDIPEYVRVKCIYGDEKTIKAKIINNIKKLNGIMAIKVPFYIAKSKTAKSIFKQEEYLAKIMPIQSERYDVAIAYHTPASFPIIYVSKYLKADKKYVWIHSDVEIYKEEMKKYISYYSNFNKIYCVSEYAKEKFVGLYPYLCKRTEVFYNIINDKKLIMLSNKGQGFTDKYDGINILTVGRLTKQKGYDILPKIVRTLLNEGFDIRWYCIGDGELRGQLEEAIKKEGLEERILLLGTIVNPYPYFKTCDIYVQPSRHEGYCLTLAEAKIFNKPIITTDFVGAREQIISNKTGLIVDFNERELINGIKRILLDRSICKKFSQELINEKINKNN